MPRLSRTERGRVQRVLGPIDPAYLGPTLMHEHLLWGIRTPGMRADPDRGPEISLCTHCAIRDFHRKSSG